jgi:hypothetical protein
VIQNIIELVVKFGEQTMIDQNNYSMAQLYQQVGII